MPEPAYPLVAQVGRVPSKTVPLDREQELRFARLMESIIMIDLHQHPLVLPERTEHFQDYLANGPYRWGYEAARHGGWSAVGTANVFRAGARAADMSFIAFDQLVYEIGAMLADLSLHGDIAVKVTNAEEIIGARQHGKVGFLPTVEHLGIGDDLGRLDVLYALGVRIGGLTYSRRNAAGDGQNERTDAGLSRFGHEVIARMNELGMVIDVSHAGHQTALETIERSAAPVVFSHNASYTLRPTARTRRDDELLACAPEGRETPPMVERAGGRSPA